jgi:tetratricopeptide (TPR) repeat protein
MPALAASQLHRTQRLSRSAAAWLVLLAVLGPLAGPVQAANQPDLLSRARSLYNEQRYDEAISTAEKVLQTPAQADSARLVIGRCYLERFRLSARKADLDAGREALRQVQAPALTPRDRVQLLIGLGETLYLDNAFGPAAELFSSAMGGDTPPDLRDTVLDWWANALDRLALTRAADDREDLYLRIVDRAEEELSRDSSAMSAAYWIAGSSFFWLHAALLVALTAGSLLLAFHFWGADPIAS